MMVFPSGHLAWYNKRKHHSVIIKQALSIFVSLWDIEMLQDKCRKVVRRTLFRMKVLFYCVVLLEVFIQLIGCISSTSDDMAGSAVTADGKKSTTA